MSLLHTLPLADAASAADGLWPWLMHEGPRLFTQLNDFLRDLAQAFGVWTYVVLFVIVFCETGLVVTPFLPGDSLLFAAGAVCAMEGSTLDVRAMAGLLFAAALLGDNLNYRLGRFAGPRAFSGRIRLLNPAHLEKTRHFFGRHGGKAVVMARFVPIVRTFAPFVAGVGAMPYRRFLGFSILGAALWVGACLSMGWWFGNLDWVRRNFSAVVLAIVALSLLPIAVEWWRHRRTGRAAKADA